MSNHDMFKGTNLNGKLGGSKVWVASRFTKKDTLGHGNMWGGKWH